MGVSVHVAVRMILNMDWMLFLFYQEKLKQEMQTVKVSWGSFHLSQS